MRNEAAMAPLLCITLSSRTVVFTLLNVRGLYSHLKDMECDIEVLTSDILLLTETQYKIGEANQATCLGKFVFHHHICENKFDSLSIAVKPGITVSNINCILGSLCFQITKLSLNVTMIVLLLYVKHSMKIQDFLYLISHWLSNTDGKIYIILGDFNINFFDENEELKRLLEDYIMIVMCYHNKYLMLCFC